MLSAVLESISAADLGQLVSGTPVCEVSMPEHDNGCCSKQAVALVLLTTLHAVTCAVSASPRFMLWVCERHLAEARQGILICLVCGRSLYLLQIL